MVVDEVGLVVWHDPPATNYNPRNCWSHSVRSTATSFPCIPVTIPTTVMDIFHPDSPLLVVKGVATLSAAGTLVGATYGVVRSLNPYAIAINMGLNGSILGLSFFGESGGRR
jgi:hypothetical protein